MQLLLADDWFHHAIDLINKRYDLHHNLAQPRFEAVSFPTKAEVPLESLEAILGVRLATELRQVTDALYEFVDRGCQMHEQTGLRLFQELKHLFPEYEFFHVARNPSYGELATKAG